MNRNCLVFVIIFFLPFFVYAREEHLTPLFIDLIGSGLTGISKNTNSRNVFMNSSFSSKTEGLTVIDLCFAYSKTINEIYSNPDSLEQKVLNALGGVESYGYITLGGPLYVSFSIENMQFVAFHYLSTSFRIYYDNVPFPSVYGGVRFYDNLGIGGSVSFPIPFFIFGSKWEEAYIGGSLFIFQRVKAINEKISFTDISGMSDPLSFLNDKLNPGRALSFTFNTSFSYSYQDITFGLTVYNLLSFPMVYYPIDFPIIYKSKSSSEITNYFDHMPFDIATGISYKTKRLGDLPLYLMRDFVFSLEFFDLTDTVYYPYFIDKLRIGLECVLVDIIRFRLGLLHRNMTFGIGYKIWIFDINSAYWSERVGKNTATNLGFSISIEF